MSDPRDTPIYSGMMGRQMNQPQTPQPVNAQSDLDAQIEAAINSRVDAVAAKYADRIKQLEDQLEAAKAANALPLTGPVAEHAAGPGYEVSPTWGQWHQELARAGLLTDEILANAGYVAKVV